MEEQCWEAVASPAVDDKRAEPPSQAWRPDQERVDGADGYGKGIVADGAAVGGHGRYRRDEVGLSWRRIAFGEIDFDIDTGGFAELGFGDPCQQKVGGGYGVRI